MNVVPVVVVVIAVVDSPSLAATSTQLSSLSLDEG